MDRRRKKLSWATMSIFLDSLGGSIDNVDVATFDSDGTDLKALIVGIEPVQSGTGDPSPDNIRLITGHSSVNVIVSPTLNPLDGTITNIPLGTTVYGGTRDVLTGVLTVTMAMVDLGTLTWAPPISANPNCFTARDIAAAIKSRDNSLCDTYMALHGPTSSSAINSAADKTLMINKGENGTTGNYPIGTIIVKDSDYASMTADEFKDAMSGVHLVYELANPQTIQLTGQQIATFLGTNNVWCDSGKIIHLEY